MKTLVFRCHAPGCKEKGKRQVRENKGPQFCSDCGMAMYVDYIADHAGLNKAVRELFPLAVIREENGQIVIYTGKRYEGGERDNMNVENVPPRARQKD